MIKNLAKIESVGSKTLTVICQQQSSCHACAARNTCSSAIFSKVMPSRTHQFQVVLPENNQIEFKPGDWIEIGLEEESLVKGALLLYVMPLISMLIFAFIGLYVTGTEGGSILFSLLGLVSGLFIARFQSKKMVVKASYKPVFLKYLGERIPQTNK